MQHHSGQVSRWNRQPVPPRPRAITPAEVAAIRAVDDRNEPYTLAEFAPFLAMTKDVMSNWGFRASHKDNETNRAWDGDAKSRWSSGTAQSPGMWFQFEMRQPLVLTRVTLDSLASKDDYPRAYEIRVSDDGETWSEPVVTGEGTAMTSIQFPPQTLARLVRITQTGSDKGCFWSFNELVVYGMPENKPE